MKKQLTTTLKIITILYIAFLFLGFVVYKPGGIWEQASFLTYAKEFSNIIPFKTFFELAQTPGAQNIPVILRTFWLNFLALIPFGVLFCLTFPAKNIGHCAIAAAVLTFLINVVKLVSRRGAYDIDDIIVGTVGAVFAFLVTKLVLHLARRRPTAN